MRWGIEKDTEVYQAYMENVGPTDSHIAVSLEDLNQGAALSRIACNSRPWSKPGHTSKWELQCLVALPRWACEVILHRCRSTCC